MDDAIDLSRYAGSEVRIEAFEDRPVGSGGPSPRIAFAPAHLTPNRPSERPNIVLIVVDTLRADRLTAYGYPRPTSEAIESMLADRGVVVESAYAPAPWTLPSVLSVMTGQFPGELIRRDMRRYGVPGEVTTLAERLKDQGYVTAGFFGNGLLREENGLARGFDVFYSPAVDRIGFVPAHELNRSVLSWLGAQEREPFFLYVHYTDPHGPYANPEMVGERSEFFPDYEGALTGHLENLVRGLTEVEAGSDDHKHVSALYDSEVRYVDRHIADLLELIPPQTMARTLTVLTSDHGEELLDHDGWGHSRTLFEELIRVPLILRWDGRLAPGRVEGTARLVDLVPTLVAAAGGEPDPDWSGIDLLPHLERGRLPDSPVYAQAFFRGPSRGAAIADGWKLMLFNGADRRPPIAGADTRLVELDRARLDRVALYDLEADPGETTNLAESDPEGRLARLARPIHEQLDGQIEGLRLVATGLGPGARLEVELELGGPPRGWWPYFLSERDRVTERGRRLELELIGDGLDKGIVLLGVDQLRAVRVRLEGRELAATAVRAGTGPWRGEPMAVRELDRGPRWPGGDEPELHLWYSELSTPESPSLDPNSELVRQLVALGYLDG